MNGGKRCMKKWSMMMQITECEIKSSRAFLKSKAERRMMLNLRGGTAAFQIEKVAWIEEGAEGLQGV